MPVKKMQLAPNPKKVKRLRIEPTKKINRFDRANDVREAKTLDPPANDEMLDLRIGSLILEIRPVSALIAQIHYAPDGPMIQEEIYSWVYHQERRFYDWSPAFSKQVLAAWKTMVKEL